MKHLSSFFHASAMAMTGFVVCLACFGVVAALDAFGGVAPQFGLPLVVAAFMAGATLILSRRAQRQAPAEQAAQTTHAPLTLVTRRFADTGEAASDDLAAANNTQQTVPVSRRSQPAAANFRSVMVIRRRPEARYRTRDVKEPYDLAA